MATGKELKRLRIKAGKSAQAAADLIGVGAERLRKWEQNDADPQNQLDIDKIESYFGTSLEKLEYLESFNFIKRDSQNSSQGQDKEKELLYELTGALKRGEEARTYERKSLGMLEGIAEILIRNQAYSQVMIQYLVRMHPDFQNMTVEQVRAKVEADVDMVQKGLQKAISGQKF